MLFNTLNLIFLNVTMPNWTTKICAQISLAGLYFESNRQVSSCSHVKECYAYGKKGGSARFLTET